MICAAPGRLAGCTRSLLHPRLQAVRALDPAAVEPQNRPAVGSGA